MSAFLVNEVSTLFLNMNYFMVTLPKFLFHFTLTGGVSTISACLFVFARAGYFWRMAI
jgi:hypothetical protein